MLERLKSLQDNLGGSIHLSNCPFYETEIQIKYFQWELTVYSEVGCKCRTQRAFQRVHMKKKKECKDLTDNFSSGLDADIIFWGLPWQSSG